MGFGMQAAGAAMSAASAANLQQMQMNHQTGTAISGNGRGRRCFLDLRLRYGKYRKVLQRVRKAQTRRRMDLQLRHGKFGEILQ